MNNNKQLIKILGIINNSSKPMRTDKEFSEADVKLIMQLIDEDYITGKWTYTNTLPITNIKSAARS